MYNRQQSAAFKCKLYTALSFNKLILYTSILLYTCILLFSQNTHAQENPNDDPVYSTLDAQRIYYEQAAFTENDIEYNTINIDEICNRRYYPSQTVRLDTENNQIALNQSMTNRSLTTVYIAARLVPEISNGWFLPRLFWNDVAANRSFYTQYWDNGTAANNFYTNWQQDGLPPTTEVYGERPLVLHTLNAGWRVFRPNETAIWIPCLVALVDPNNANWQFQSQIDQYGLYYFNITLSNSKISIFTRNLDSFCLRQYANGRALRVIDAEVQENLTASMTARNIDQAYIGARLMPWFSRGWYWASDLWENNTGFQFYTDYSNNGSTPSNADSNFADGSTLPSPDDEYGALPLLLYNRQQNVSIPNIPENISYLIACTTNEQQLNYTTPPSPGQVDENGIYFANVTLTEGDIQNNAVNLDQYCEGENASGQALRITSEEIQQYLENSLAIRNIDVAFIGARLMPQFTNGWYWAADDWNDTLGVLFFSEYWRNGTAVNGAYTNFASATSLPDPSDPNGYGYYPLLIQNQSAGGWETFRPSGTEVYVACTVNASTINYTTGPEDNGTSNKSNETFFTMIRVNGSDINSVWDSGGLDALCQGRLLERTNVNAARIYTQEDQEMLQSSLSIYDPTQRLYLGARLYPDLSPGWYWAGPNWSQEGSVLFYTTYANGGASLGYANWATDGLPPNDEAYGTRQAVIYNQTVGGWQAVSLQSNGEAQVACSINQVILPAGDNGSGGNDTNETEFVLITVNESDINSVWDNGGLDALCQGRLSGEANVSAARIYTQEDQEMLQSSLSIYDPTQRLYLGARLYPDLSPGWYWAGPNWSQEGSVLFYTTYANGGASLGYANWATDGLPPNDEAYGTRQAVIYNESVGWVTVELQSNGEAQVACSINQILTPSRGNFPYYFIVMNFDEAEFGTFTTNQPITLNSQENLLLADSNVDFTWIPGGLDALCQSRLTGFQNVTAARLYTQQDEALLQSSLWNYTSNLPLFIGARLYPQLTQGWYWAGPNWAQDGAQLFYTTYNEGRQTVGFSDWAPVDGLPPAGEPYLTRQGVSYNQSISGWQAMIIQEERPTQILCAINQSTFVIPPTVTNTIAPGQDSESISPWRYVHHGMAYYGYIIIFVPIAVIIIVGTVIAFAALFACMPAGYLTGNTQPYYELRGRNHL